MTRSTLKKIKTADLKPGMHLHGLCGSWMDHPFWRSKFTLNDPADIRRILDSGIVEVWIDTAKGDDLPAAASRKPPMDPAPLSPRHTRKQRTPPTPEHRNRSHWTRSSSAQP